VWYTNAQRWIWKGVDSAREELLLASIALRIENITNIFILDIEYKKSHDKCRSLSGLGPKVK
jgi:hypothetical protein